jgi:hypothetical protein
MNVTLNNQKLTEAKRREDDSQWYRQQIEYLDKISFRGVFKVSNNDISEYEKNRINYDLVNNKVNLRDFEYIISPIGEEVGELPATFTNKDILSSKIKALQGLEMRRPFSWKVMAVNEEVTTRREQEEFGRYKEFVIGQVMQPIKEQILMKYEEEMKGRELTKEEQQQIQQQIQQEINAATPEEVKKYMLRDHQDPVEAMASQLLEYLVLKNRMAEKFNLGWKHALIAAREVYNVVDINGETVTKVVNPLRFDSDTSTDIYFVEDGEWAVCEFRMRPSEILNVFDMTDEEIDQIYQIYNYNNAEMISNDMWFQNNYVMTNEGNSIRVLHCTWKSLTKVGFLMSVDLETGEPVMSMVDETYTLDESIGDISLEWEWIPSVYEGYKIGRKIYKNMGPIPQARSLENPYYCKLPYYGAVYDNTNSAPTSLVDRMKVYQYYYNIIMYRIELLMASDKGKLLLMNINTIPKGIGLDYKKWMYYAEASKIGWVNPSEEGNMNNNMGELAKEIDMSLASDIQNYIDLAEYIELRCGLSVGINKQMEGQIAPNEAVRNTEMNIGQSSVILEPYFDLHNSVKRNVLEGMLENAKLTYANSDKKKLTYIMDDLSRHILDLDPNQLLLSDFGIFVANSSKAGEAKELITSLTHAAMQNQKIELSDVIKVVRSEGVQEAEELLMVAEQRRREEENKMEEQKMAHEKELEKAKMDFQREAWDREDQQIILKEKEKRETVIQQQAILSVGFNQEKDFDNDQELDVLEVAKAGVDADIKARKLTLEENKLDQDKKEHEDKMKIEEKKLKQNKAKKA